MILLHNIKHWLQTKIYHAVINIQDERNKELFTFKSVGKNISIGKDILLTGPQYIEIGDNFRALSHFRIQAIHANKDNEPSIKIGNNVSCEDFCHIGCIEKVNIGDGTLIASKVFITDHSHGQALTIDPLKPFDRKLISKPVIIGKHCWLGDGVCILPGVTLGDNVIVGANAVVTHSFPSNTVIAGCPAKVIRKLR